MSGQSFILGEYDVLSVEDMITLATTNGGATLIPLVTGNDGELMYINQDKIKDGYMVSVAGKGRALFSHELTAEEIARYVRTTFIPYRDAFPSGLTQVPFFGLWRDAGRVRETDVWYLDVSLYIQDKATAVHMARTTGELAIWDNAAGVALSMHE